MKMKRIVLAGLAGVAALSLASCGGNNGNTTTTTPATGTTTPTSTTTEEVVNPMDLEDEEVYDLVYGDFYDLYQGALEETANLSKRFAQMAVAEAKLLETGSMLPTTTQGGNYAVTKVAPRTVNSTLWGNDEYRLYSMVVAQTPIKKEDRAAMIANWNAHKAEANYDHIAYVKQYLGDHGYTVKRNYAAGYTSDPETYDVLSTSMAADSEVLVNCYDGLIEYNMNNVQVGKVATGLPTVSSDKKTYTFHLKQGLKWVNQDGTDSGYTVKADDFVAGFQHMLDNEEGLGWLVDGVVEGVSGYIGGDKDFAKVGVKAVDDYTLEYKLTGDVPYFQSMFAYSLFAPMQRQFYTSKGGGFGAAFNAEAESYVYGKNASNILYNGPYRLTATDSKNQIVFTKNDSYADKDSVNIDTITWKYNDGQDTSKAYNDFKNNVIDGCGLNSYVLPNSKQEKFGTDTGTIFDTYSYVTDTNATTYINFFNVHRTCFDLNGLATSTKTDAQKKTSAYAGLNQNFRLAVQQSVDRVTSNAISVGAELAPLSLRNSYTPYNFVTLSEAVTLKINGTDKTFAAGTNYGEIVQAQITADGYSIKAYDATKGSGDGYDGWYNPTAAKALMTTAVTEINAELAKAGLPAISKTNKVVIEYPTQSSSEIYLGKANALKQSVEAAIGDYVEVKIVGLEQRADWLTVCYRYADGAHANFDINDLSGWGPDYGDPQSYLDTMLPYGNGYMLKAVGLW